MKKISSDLGHQNEHGQYFTLSVIMTKLRHNVVDILKMDIERHEFAVVESLPRTAAKFVKQILFEVHLHNAYGMWGGPVTFTQWENMWRKVDLMGYGVFSHEINQMLPCCCEFSLKAL